MVWKTLKTPDQDYQLNKAQIELKLTLIFLFCNMWQLNNIKGKLKTGVYLKCLFWTSTTAALCNNEKKDNFFYICATFSLFYSPCPGRSLTPWPAPCSQMTLRLNLRRTNQRWKTRVRSMKRIFDKISEKDTPIMSVIHQHQWLNNIWHINHHCLR